MYVMAIAVCAGLTIGNFIYQAFTKRNWGKAAELSLYQMVALGLFLLVTANH